MVATSSLSAQFFDRKWEGLEIARDSFGQNAVIDIGSGDNITVAEVEEMQGMQGPS